MLSIHNRLARTNSRRTNAQKAVMGGGGKGMRIVNNERELQEAMDVCLTLHIDRYRLIDTSRCVYRLHLVRPSRRLVTVIC
jgi:hypothetical protein